MKNYYIKQYYNYTKKILNLFKLYTKEFFMLIDEEMTYAFIEVQKKIK